MTQKLRHTSLPLLRAATLKTTHPLPQQREKQEPPDDAGRRNQTLQQRRTHNSLRRRGHARVAMCAKLRACGPFSSW